MIDYVWLVPAFPLIGVLLNGLAGIRFSKTLPGFVVAALSLIMMLTVTGVSFVIHVYSVGYMHDDPGFRRYFTYLNLFVFFMLILVSANSFLLMFIGWGGAWRGRVL